MLRDMYITLVVTDHNRKKTGYNPVMLQLVATGLFYSATARDRSLPVAVAVGTFGAFVATGCGCGCCKTG